MPRKRAVAPISDFQTIAWLAGYLEGEGSFYNLGNSIFVSVQTTDEDIANRVAVLLNGTAYPTSKRKQHHKQAYIVKVGGERAKYYMQLLRPYMGIRRTAQIDSCLGLNSARKTVRTEERTGLTDEQLVAAYIASRNSSVRELARQLSCCRRTLARRLNQLGLVPSSAKLAPVDEFIAPPEAAYPCLEECIEITHAWFAGLMEGEGYFALDRNRLMMALKMTDRDIVERVSRLTGNAVTQILPEQNGWLPLYKSVVTGENARGWMQHLLPHLGARRSARVRALLEVHHQRKQQKPPQWPLPLAA